MTAARSRRSSDEVRELMLKSARSLFRSKGFEGTSTREISAKAGVSESMLFRHFRSKSILFEEAVLNPFVEFVQSFLRDWEARPPADVVPERLAERYVSGLFELCIDNLDLITALAERIAGGPGRPAAQAAADHIAGHLDRITRQVETYHGEIALTPSMDPALAVRLTVAIVIGAAQLGPAWFGLADQHLTEEIAAFVVRGAGYPSDGRVTRCGTGRDA